jgi:hypothetical protein
MFPLINPPSSHNSLRVPGKYERGKTAKAYIIELSTVPEHEAHI